MQSFTVGSQIDALIEDLEGAYEDLGASDDHLGDCYDALEIAKKRVEEDAAKVAELRGRLEQRYPALKGMVWDHMLAAAKSYRREVA